MKLDVTDREDWPTLKSEQFEDGRILIMKRSNQDYQILLLNKGDPEIVEVFTDSYSAVRRFSILKELIK